MDVDMGSSMTCVDQEVPEGRPVTAKVDGTIYHEKQSRELCALHALNNLCQEKIFTKRDLDTICYTLSPEAYVNPHKSMFGLGNYDVNVIMAALQTKDLDTVWFDKRKDINGLVLENIHGLIMNIPMDYKWGILHLPLRRKHWIVIRRIGRGYYNLDSKLALPELIGTLTDVRRYLREQMQCKDKELLLVVNQLVSVSGSWWRHPAAAPVEGDKVKDAPPGLDGAGQEVELTVDCHIVCNDDTTEKPKHLKKYHQDYVPIEIHRTFHKKEGDQTATDAATETAAAEVNGFGGREAGEQTGPGDLDGGKVRPGDQPTGKAVPGDKDGRKAVTGDKDGRKAVTGDKDGRKAGTGDKDGRNAVTGDKDGRKAGTGDKDGRKAVTGDKDGRKAVTGDKDGRKVGTGDKDGRKARTGDKDGRNAMTGDKDGRKAGTGDQEGRKRPVGVDRRRMELVTVRPAEDALS